MSQFLQTEHSVRFEPADRLTSLPDRSVHLVVTSPPYPMIEMWDRMFADQDLSVADFLAKDRPEEAFEEMHGVLDRTWAQIARVICPGGIVCVNIGDAARTAGGIFRLFPNHARIIRAFRPLGFHNLPNIIWRKPTNAPNKFMGSGMLPPGAYVTLEHEYILVFRFGHKREFTTPELRARRTESAFFWEERNQRFSDVWFDLTGTGQALPEKNGRDRSAAFPVELPWRLINMFSIKGDTVLDPYLGTGTTTLAALVSERNSLGFEIEPSLRTVIARRLKTAPALSLAMANARIKLHREFSAQRKSQGKPLPYRLTHHDLSCVSRQETGIKIRQVDRIEWLSDTTCRANYRDLDS